MQKPRILKEEVIYEGYTHLSQFKVQIPSLNPEKQCLNLQREVLKTNDSVHVLIYIPQIDSFIFCQEFRVGVFLNQSHDDPYIYTCVAGTIENSTPEETAFKEIFEETGLQVQDLQEIASFYKSPGLITEKSYLYYSELNEIPMTGFFGIGEEEIKTHIIQRQTVWNLIENGNIIDSVTILGLYWFKSKKLR